MVTYILLVIAHCYTMRHLLVLYIKFIGVDPVVCCADNSSLYSLILSFCILCYLLILFLRKGGCVLSGVLFIQLCWCLVLPCVVLDN